VVGGKGRVMMQTTTSQSCGGIWVWKVLVVGSGSCSQKTGSIRNCCSNSSASRLQTEVVHHR
jgi:hypothetical protein